MDLPEFDAVCLSDYDLIEGFYTLGMVKKHFPDWVVITPGQWPYAKHTYDDYKWLDTIIRSNIGRKILVMPWDECISYPHNQHLSNILNRYADQDVFFVTQFDHHNQKLYTYQHGLRCKIIELPFWLTNDALCYHAVRSTLNLSSPLSTDMNFLCMMGRPDSHKKDLLKALIYKNMHVHGHLTVTKHTNDAIIDTMCPLNPIPPYQISQTRWHKMAAQVSTPGICSHTVAHKTLNDIWISDNVENYLAIEQTYDMPLIINAESGMGYQMPSEKTLWPALLGRLYMIYAHPGAMSWVQRFVQTDQRSWIDLEFDSLDSWTIDQQHAKLDTMLDRNLHLIKHSRDIYQDFRESLELDRAMIVRNLYNFFRSQLRLIAEHVA